VKGLLGLREMSRGELGHLLDKAMWMRAGGDHGRPLSGRAVATIFFEPSTRTRLSFELAAQRLGAHVLGMDPAVSSERKGETLRDTCNTIAAIGAEILVVRHHENGAPARVQEWTSRPVINAGDGTNEHPTQALADLLTLRDRFGAIDGVRIGIVGDIGHSRVVGSLLLAAETMGAEVCLVGPEELLPPSNTGRLSMSRSLDDALGLVDVLYMLRVQRERGAVIGDDYIRRFCLTQERASQLADGVVVMHPGPINRGVEIEDQVADGPRSLILSQVANGTWARAAVLGEIGEAL
jgi:aspartate carbamoyltransferase catalytic subunit